VLVIIYFIYAKFIAVARNNCLLPGSGKVKQSFICINDVAAFMVKALTVPSAKHRIIELETVYEEKRIQVGLIWLYNLLLS
jgi:nucleoside-diphosphate-sugar epimerase